MNMLPLPFNNSEPSFKDLIEEQTDVFQISQLDIIDSLESIKKIQKDIFDISFKMYNLQEEQFELAKSQLFDQKEFMDEQRRALNNSGTDFDGDTSSNNNETVSKLPGGAGGGSKGMMGGALAGAGRRYWISDERACFWFRSICKSKSCYWRRCSFSIFSRSCGC
jgi:hypothetical protein